MATTAHAKSVNLKSDGSVLFDGRDIGTWARDDDQFYRYKPTGSTVWVIQAGAEPHLRSAISALNGAAAHDDRRAVSRKRS